MELSIILPAYNEEQCIERAILKVLDAVKNFCQRYEIIIVDDGSSDRTSEIASSLARENPCLRLIKHEKNTGYSCAIMTGIKNATMPFLFFMDSDNQFDPEDLNLLIPLTEKYDIVTGYRTERKDTEFRIFLSQAYNKLISRLFGLDLKDINCAFKIFRKSIFDSLEVKSRRFLFNAELLVRAKKLGLSTGQVPVRHFPRSAGKSKIRMMDLIITLHEIIRLYREI
jgi:dolichol-phosphate mannosyltransferase